MSSEKQFGRGARILRRGLMLVLSSPSGAGKTTVSRRLLQNDDNLTMSISVTTRRRRPGEVDGVDYIFVDNAEFSRMLNQKELLEHAKVFDNYYGTPIRRVEEALSAGLDVLFDIDWQGTQQVAQAARGDVASIVILPPSTRELERRLTRRAQDSAEVVARRMSKAADEMSHWREYDYIVVNDEIDDTVSQVTSILAAERLRRDRQIGLVDFVGHLRQGH
tara:strand:+ start:85 stop:744 length:660 start_codon:yes stop_codon:yes gene_type:complete